MSVLGLPVSAKIDPLLALDSKEEFSVIFGGSQVNWQPIISTSYSNNWVSYTVTPTNLSQVLDPKVYQLWNVQLTFAGTSASGNLLQLGLSDGLRQFPIAAAIGQNTIQVQQNGNNSATVNQDFIAALTSYTTTKDDQDRDLSLTPSMPDMYQNYGDWKTYGSARNPLCFFGENSSQVSRGAFTGITVVSNTPTAAVVNVLLAEPIFVSPLAQIGKNKGFVGLQTFLITANILSFARMWSHDAINGNNITSITGAFLSAPQLLTKYLQPYAPITRQIYPFDQIQRFVQAGQSIAPNATAQLSNSSMELTVIPHKLLIFAQPTYSQMSYSTSDTFAAPINLQITWAGQPYMVSLVVDWL